MNIQCRRLLLACCGGCLALMELVASFVVSASISSLSWFYWNEGGQFVAAKRPSLILGLVQHYDPSLFQLIIKFLLLYLPFSASLLTTVFAQSDTDLDYSPPSNCRRTANDAGRNSRRSRILAAPSIESIAHAHACLVHRTEIKMWEWPTRLQ